MTDLNEVLAATAGDGYNWPVLQITYLTNPENIAKLLPPGFEVGEKAEVALDVYNFPINGHPEFGLLTQIACKYNGVEGHYTLGYAIDRESEIFVSQDRFSQPKYPGNITYFRLADHVEARVSHENYTFFEFSGQVTELQDPGPEFTRNEFWVKFSRPASFVNFELGSGFDYPPHVVNVVSKFGTAQNLKVVGKLTLRDSPWDPIAQLLPIESEPEARLWTPIFLDRTIELGDALDADAFEKCCDFIGNTRYPGTNGGPLKS